MVLLPLPKIPNSIFINPPSGDESTRRRDEEAIIDVRTTLACVKARFDLNDRFLEIESSTNVVQKIEKSSKVVEKGEGERVDRE